MPHGGGGGSRGGGHISAGGGFRGGVSGAGAGNVQHISNTPYRGAHRYIYYYRRMPHVYYSDRMVGETHDAWAGIFISLLGLAVAILIFCYIATYQQGGKLERDYDDAIVIDDRLGIVKDEAKLCAKLSEFQEQTGITICVFTREERRHFSHTSVGLIKNIEQYSYSAYTENFGDEKHWVIFYAGLDTERMEDWAWYLTCGDECIRVLDYDEEDRFTRNLQDFLMDTENYSFEDAVIKAVDSLHPNMKGRLVFRSGFHVGNSDVGGTPFSLRALGGLLGGEPEVDILFTGVGLCVVGVFIFISLKKQDDENKARAKAFETPDVNGALSMAKCPHCGLDYYIGTVEVCPYCGRSL